MTRSADFEVRQVSDQLEIADIKLAKALRVIAAREKLASYVTDLAQKINDPVVVADMLRQAANDLDNKKG
jgi:hypothetical protein